MDYLTEHQEKILSAAKMDLNYGLLRSLVNMVDCLLGKLSASSHTIIDLQTQLDYLKLSTKTAEQASTMNDNAQSWLNQDIRTYPVPEQFTELDVPLTMED